MACQAHPVGAQALADANRSFGLKRDGLGRRMWEDLPVPVLSDSADVPRFVQVPCLQEGPTQMVLAVLALNCHFERGVVYDYR